MFDTPLWDGIIIGLGCTMMLIFLVFTGRGLGIGILMAAAPKNEHDAMVSAIEPLTGISLVKLLTMIFYLLLGLLTEKGFALITFYIPIFVMLSGWGIRGLALNHHGGDFVGEPTGPAVALIIGSTMAAVPQGWMIGFGILNFTDFWGPPKTSWYALLFAALLAVSFTAIYAALGATRLIRRTDGALQSRATRWVQWCAGIAAGGFVLALVTLPFASPYLFRCWFR